MSAAAKVRVAKQPRQAGGRFGSTINATEAKVASLEAALDKAHAVSSDRMDKLTNTLVMLAKAEDDVRLLTIGNKQLIEERDTWKRRAESQLDTIAGDRKQITRMAEALGLVGTLLNCPPLQSRASVDDWGSDLRDAYDQAMRADAEALYASDVAERDHLRGELGLAKEQRDAINARLNASRTTLALATFLVLVLFLSSLVFGVALLMPGSTGGVK
jgi:hypothetical protein